MNKAAITLGILYAMADSSGYQPHRRKQHAGTDTRIQRDHSARIAAAEAKRQRRAQKRKEQQ